MQSTVQSEHNTHTHTHKKEKEGIEVKQFLKPMLGFIMIVGQPLLVIIIYIFPKKKKSAACNNEDSYTLHTSMRPEVFPLSDNLSICTSTNRIWELFQSPKNFQIELFVTLAFHHNNM